MRYVRFENGDFILAPEGFEGVPTHSQLARLFDHKPISAGFAHIGQNNDAICYGKSESLRLEANEETDSAALSLWLGLP